MRRPVAEDLAVAQRQLVVQGQHLPPACDRRPWKHLIADVENLSVEDYGLLNSTWRDALDAARRAAGRRIDGGTKAQAALANSTPPTATCLPCHAQNLLATTVGHEARVGCPTATQNSFSITNSSASRDSAQGNNLALC